jgi:tetratricopeptide (TPR) repeat protein
MLSDQQARGDAVGTPVFAPGQIVSDRYRIIRFINHGGMGEVYEAEDLELKGRVAIKTLLPAIAEDSRMIARFKQEIQLSRKVSHPNVCRVFDLSRHQIGGNPTAATVFLTMEFLEGETLSSHLRREGRISAEQALPLLSQMADALGAAHHAGVIHRDFKPSNVILVPSADGPHAVVTDFGLARNSGASPDTTATLTGTIMGTLDYMAPELLSRGKATVASDVYALGTVAYKMVTGKLPFAAGEPLASVILRSKGPPPSPRSIIPELDIGWEHALLCALDPDPARRPVDPYQLILAIQCESSTVTVPMPKPSRRLLIMAAVVTLLILIGGGLGWRSWLASRNQPSGEGLRWYQNGVEALRDATYYKAARALERAVSLDPGFALAHARLAEAWNELDDSDKAKDEMLRALEDQSTHPAPRRADALYVEAIHRILVGDFPRAILTYTELAGQVPGAENPQVLVDLGRARERNNEIAKALEAYREAARLDPQNAAAHLRAAVLLGPRQRKLEDAAREFAQADSLYQALSNTEGQAEVLYQRGLLATTLRKLPEARAALEKAIQLAHAISSQYQEIAATIQLSNVTYLEGDAAHAEEMAFAAVDQARRSGKANLAARGLTDLAIARFGRADYTGAEKDLHEAIDLARRFHLYRNEARALLQLAAIHLQQGNAQSALQEAEPALAFYQRAGFPLETTQSLTAMARAHRDLGRYPEARAEFEQLLSLARSTGDRQQIMSAEQGMASFFFQTDRWPEALDHYEKHYELARQSGDYAATGIGLINRAKVLWRLGRYRDADALLKQAEAMMSQPARDSRLPSLIAGTRSEMALSQNLFRLAAARARQVIEMTSTTKTALAAARCIAGLAKARAGSVHDAKALCEEGISIASALGDQVSVMDHQLALAEILAAASQPRQAQEQARLARQSFQQAGRKESEWRSWVVEARALRRGGDPTRAAAASSQAAACLTDLQSLWGAPVFDRYRQRNDIQYYLREIKK